MKQIGMAFSLTLQYTVFVKSLGLSLFLWRSNPSALCCAVNVVKGVLLKTEGVCWPGLSTGISTALGISLDPRI
jgi:hypothetical protein